IVGEFSGTITLYSRSIISNRFVEKKDCERIDDVMVHGILVAATGFCCKTEVHPVGLGYYEWDGVSYPVRIYWGRSVVVDGEENTEYLAPAADELSPSQANGVAWSDDAEQVISGLEKNGAEVTFSKVADILAVGDNSTPDDSTDDIVIIIDEADSLSLEPGNWTLCPVDLSGTNGEGEVMTLTVSDTIAMSLELERGWNLIGIPEKDSLTWDSIPTFDALCDNLKSMPLYTLDSRAMVMTDFLKPGKAYWVYATEPQSFKLAGKNPESGKSNPMIGGWVEKTLQEDGKTLKTLKFESQPLNYDEITRFWYWKNGYFKFTYKPIRSIDEGDGNMLEGVAQPR
ncbi:MAG: hypothetical protein J6X55_15530, partial [Victivallales bacterium]|nr:hypothetical protein [Victivallales bacterium]